MALYEVTEHYVKKGKRSVIIEAESEELAIEMSDSRTFDCKDVEFEQDIVAVTAELCEDKGN